MFPYKLHAPRLASTIDKTKMPFAKLLCICAAATSFHISLTAPDSAKNDRVVLPNSMEVLILRVNVLVPRFLKVSLRLMRT